MALERRYALNREVQSSNDATRILTLPRTGILSGIGLRVEITNGATRGTERIFEAIDRIEVIANGSEVIYSLTGVEAYKWQYVHLRRRPPHVWTEVGGAVQELMLQIPFGRYLGDPELALDLSRYQSVELRIQFSPTISATTFATGTVTFSAILYTWRQGSYAGQPRGFLRTSQTRDFTSAASGEDVHELPRRFPILDLLVHVREAAITPDTDITLAEVREDSGLVIPYTGRFLDIAEENAAMLGLDPTEHGIALLGDTDTFDTHLTRVQGLALTPVFTQSDANGVITTSIQGVTADRVTASASDTADAAAATHFTAAAAARQHQWIARGLGLPQALLIPLWDMVDLASAYDAPSKSKVELALTQGGAGATVRASVRELAN